MITSKIDFQIAAKNHKRAAQFYKFVFNWKKSSKPSPDGWAALSMDKQGRTLTIEKTNKKKPPEMWIQVANIDRTMQCIVKKGGKLFGEKIKIPGFGFACKCQDTEGNVFGILENPSQF